MDRRERAAWSRRGFIAAALATAGTAVLRARGSLSSSEKILEEAVSPYNHIVVAERGTVRTMYFVVDGTYYIESRLDRGFPQSLDLDYTRTMMAGFLVQPRVERLLMIGFGGGQISNYLFERFPGIEIDAVDIDAEVIRLARKYFEVPDDPRYRTHAADGRLFVEQAPATQKWDMILLDAFRGVFVPYHLKTVEYYETLRQHLTPKGVVVANLHTRTQMYPNDRNTFAQVFPSGYAFQAESSRQIAYVAGRSGTPLGAYALRDNARALQQHFDFDLLGLASRWSLSSDWDRSAPVLHDDFPPGQTPRAADRHNERCHGPNCPYRVTSD